MQNPAITPAGNEPRPAPHRTTVLDPSAVSLRPGTPDDAEACGRICYEAFSTIARQHNFPPDFPTIESAVGFMKWILAHPGFYGVVAEVDGQIAGSNFLDERSLIAGLGPITVNPDGQNRRVGRRLMQAALERAHERRSPGVRLVQAAYHGRSLALYTKLGFRSREELACLQGPPVGASIPGFTVRAATEEDLQSCSKVCRAVHGHDRAGEVLDAIRHGTARVVEFDGRVTGYATDFGYFGHAAAEGDRDLIALIGATKVFTGPGMLVPVRNTHVFQWCLNHGLRIVHVMTLMTRGVYNEPRGAYLPSILY